VAVTFAPGSEEANVVVVENPRLEKPCPQGDGGIEAPLILISEVPDTYVATDA
jgi:hypothetical protein